MININDTYTRLIALLEQHGVPYRLIDHPPEGRTNLVSAMRGHDPKVAAKCMVVMVKIGKKTTKYVLAVIPGDAKVDFEAIKRHRNASYVSFAAPEIAERLSGAVMGTVLPFSFDANLELMVDPSLLDHEDMYFNAARLDCSVVMKTRDYVTLAKPEMLGMARLEGAG